MKTFQPWTTDGGTLRLTRWPDPGPGTVLVDVDVFEAFLGRVFDSRGRERRCDLLGADGFAGTCSVPISDLQSDLFRHIDTHPQTHYTLRTRHPERFLHHWPWVDAKGPNIEAAVRRAMAARTEDIADG